MMELGTDDFVLLSQFNTWRFGYQPIRSSNSVIDAMLYNEYRRSPGDVWRKAEECAGKAESSELKAYFRKIITKYKDKTIFGQ